MKKLIFILIASLIAGSCCNNSETKSQSDPAKEKEKVALVLEKYVLANERQDVDLLKEVWSNDPDIVVIGTNSDEILEGWDQIKAVLEKQFKTFSDTYISVRDQIIHVDDTGNTAWFSEILNYNYIYKGKALQYEGLRFTGVLRKIDGDWLIVQSHISSPISVEEQR